MPTTTKMGIVYPSSTDLVKDGATAMGTISTTVDAKTGLVLINTTSFSAVSAASLPQDTFTSSFTNYKIKCSFIASGNFDLLLRLRAAGSDQTGANYAKQSGLITTALTVDRSAGNTFLRLTQNLSGTYPYTLDIDLYDPKGSGTTQIAGFGYQYYSNILIGGSYEANYSADSATILPGSGTITGTMSCFGYNK